MGMVYTQCVYYGGTGWVEAGRAQSPWPGLGV